MREIRRLNVGHPKIRERLYAEIRRLQTETDPPPSVAAISRAIGVSPGYVSRALDALGLRRRGPAVQVSNLARILGDAELMAYVAAARERNATDKEMAAHLKCSDDTIQRVRRQIGWARTPILLSQAERQARNDRIRALYAEHDGNAHAIADVMQMEYAAVESLTFSLGLVDGAKRARRGAFAERLAAAARACGRTPEQAFVDDARAAERSRLVAPRYVPISRAYVGAQSSAA